MSADGRLPRRPRSPQPEEAGLDDLLTHEERPATEAPRRPRSIRSTPWLARSVLQSFILSAVIYTLFKVGNLAPPYPLILAVCAGAVLVRRAVAATAEPEWQRLGDAVNPSTSPMRIDPGGWYEGGDGMVLAINRWDRRMEWVAGSPQRFAATVGVHLGELADERLRIRHSITRASDPVRARSLLGEEIWSMVHDQSPLLPKPRELDAVVRRLETL